jgi:HAD superfamily hydrolase (TIGR01509 family)
MARLCWCNALCRTRAKARCCGLDYFLEYYRNHMLDSTVLYPGVREALDQLHAERIPLAVLTNKPIRFTLQMLEGLGIDLHFFRVYGGNSFPEKKPDPAGLNALVTESRADRARTIMVGDSAVDVDTARNAGVRLAECGGDFSRRRSLVRRRIFDRRYEVGRALTAVGHA